MIFAITCKDKPGHLQTRMDTRPEHVAFLNDLNDKGTLKFAGPFLDEEGKPCGSLVAIEAADKAEAKAIADSDPYAKAGLFESVEIRPWNWVFNNPEQA
ncbi:YciI-like protein [Nitratireductor basaltis]|uniref:YciI-like protein n=1 Tax=Nitratireductor basaltis TaxID=472175 RepID=A0A084U754_9HYPH|nr:YciI-like protein [Nitratireductor basaltis]KFB08790.1 YciI-like protein [Nitratireductor basaltis]